MSAYLVMSFKVVKGIPRFRGVGIYSEPANSLTRMGGIEYADLMDYPGDSYGESHDKLLSYIMSQPHYAWMHPFLGNSETYKVEREALHEAMKRV